MAVFVVDSNFFIEAHRITYPLDIAIGFWGKVRELANRGAIISIDKVKEELYNKNDLLEAWCSANLPDDFFKDTTEALTEYSMVSAWAISKKSHYLPKALHEFLDVDEADAFLVAYCLKDQANRIAVTQEISEPNRKSKVKIPDCCKALGVSYVNIIDMFRQLGETF